jgi:small subunit ribosomal protein S8
VEESKYSVIKIALKYDPVTKKPLIRELIRVSKPGLRQYKSADEIPSVINGYGIAIVSTSKGVLTDKAARAANVGGEVLCYIY